jgi:polyisoprenoid-binding protein YceI
MKRFAAVFLVAVLGAISSQALAAEKYKADPVHSSVVFRIKHANSAYFWGRFNEPAGEFTLDQTDPAKSTFSVELQAAKVDTNNERRDNHLRSPDFFNAKQYPNISFKSTSVKKLEDNRLEVAGDLTLHGQTKPVTAIVELVGKGQFPPGTQRAGVEATLNVKMSEFGIKGMPGALGDEVRIIVGLEGVKQ